MKKITAFILSLTAVLNLTACSENGNIQNTGNSDVSVLNTLNLSSGNEEITKKIEVTSDNMLNSIRIFDELSRDKERSMFSPLSLNMALGLIQSGAGGTSKSALDAYLATENYSDFAAGYLKTVKKNYNRESDEYSKYKDVFEIGNSLWADIDFPVKEEYKNELSEKFDAEIENIDFSKKSKTIKTINNWCSEKTHKMIPKIIDDYDEDSIASILINTIYFESGWINEWNYQKNVKESFTLSDSKAVNIPFMHNGYGVYFENDKATAFSARYKNGLEFIGILPKNKGDFTVEELDIPSLLESRTDKYDVSAKMPRLNFESEFPLNAVLEAAGMADVFDPDKADFSGISDLPVFVSDILQKTKLELDENGTRAAAVTEIMVGTSGAAPIEKESREVFLDRPFAFLIYDDNENQIAFIGKVSAPE